MRSDSTAIKGITDLSDGCRKTEALWFELLRKLDDQGFTIGLEVAVGVGAFVIWAGCTKPHNALYKLLKSLNQR